MADDKMFDGPEEQFGCAMAFLRYLQPTRQHWSGPHESWVFRGQPVADWGLVPGAFRGNASRPAIFKGMEDHALAGLEAQVDLEFRVVRQFVRRANECGLQVPGNVLGLLQYFENRPGAQRDSKLCKEWPRTDFLETLAICQHHGVPTRLLDFTRDPYTAAFFAGWQSWRREGKLKSTTPIAVWAVDTNFLKWNAVWHTLGIRALEVPSHANDFLQAQRALFLYDADVNLRWPESQTDLGMKIWKTYEVQKHRWRKHRDPRVSLGPVVKVTLDGGEVDSLLSLLAREGIRESVLMPHYRNVVATLEFERHVERNPW